MLTNHRIHTLINWKKVLFTVTVVLMAYAAVAQTTKSGANEHSTGQSFMNNSENEFFVDPIAGEVFEEILARDSVTSSPVTYSIWLTDSLKAFEAADGNTQNAASIADELEPWTTQVNVFLAEGDFRATMARLPDGRDHDLPSGRYLLAIIGPQTDDGPPMVLGYSLTNNIPNVESLGDPFSKIEFR